MDTISPLQRSANMRAIRSKNTKPELVVRKILRSIGFTGYRLHRKDLPGRPDIAFVGRKKAIMVHGCFWHAHDCHEGHRLPKSNCDYWLTKIANNKKRDEENITKLHQLGWATLIIWECELIDHQDVLEKIKLFMAK